MCAFFLLEFVDGVSLRVVVGMILFPVRSVAGTDRNNGPTVSLTVLIPD
jgi:hypothetical protein